MSRVGGKAQIQAMRKVAGSLKIDLANYRELQSFAQFGSDLDASTRKTLEHGQILMEVLKQPQYKPYEVEQQVYYLFVAQNDYLVNLALNEIHEKLLEGYNNLKVSNAELVKELKKTKTLSEKNIEALHKHCKDFYK